LAHFGHSGQRFGRNLGRKIFGRSNKNKSDKLCEAMTDQLRARVFISCGQAKGTDEVIVANSIASAKVAKNG